MSRLAFFTRPLGAAVVLLAAAGIARADLFTITGGGTTTGSTPHPSSFTGSIELVSVNQFGTSAVLKVALTNTSADTKIGSTTYKASQGTITGFGFNDPGPGKGDINSFKISSYTYTGSNTSSFNAINGPSSNTDLGSIFGKFDFAASVGNTLHTSGDPDRGIEAGETGTFLLTLTGVGLQSLSVANLLADSNSSTGGSQNTPFAVRFRDYNTSGLPYGGDGDKVPLKTKTEVLQENPRPVPAPPGLVLAGMGFGCLLLGRLRARRNAAA